MDELDAQLQQVKNGDLDAFEAVVRRFEGPLRAWAIAHCPPGGDADDVAQKTFIEIFRRVGEFRPGSDFRAWLFTVARFQMRAEATRLQRLADYHQRYAPRVLCEELSRRADSRAHDAEQRLEWLKSCVQKLPESHRRILAERYDESLPLEEIARRAERSVGAIKKQLFILRAKLLECVQASAARAGGPGA
jgi:RNA polymerase sigma-70 factor, ECF subfamily